MSKEKPRHPFTNTALSAFKVNDSLKNIMRVAETFKPPAWFNAMQQNSGLMQAMQLANQSRQQSLTNLMQHNSGLMQAMQLANQSRQQSLTNLVQQNSALMQAMQLANQSRQQSLTSLMQQNSGLVQAMQYNNTLIQAMQIVKKFKPKTLLNMMQGNGILAQAADSPYNDLNNTIETAINDLEEQEVTSEVIELFYQSIYRDILSLLNTFKVPRIEKKHLLQFLIFLLPILYSKYLSDSSSQQIVSNNNANTVRVIDAIVNSQKTIVDAFVKVTDSLSEPYVTVYCCKMYRSSKCRTVITQLSEGTYVNVTQIQFGSKVYIYYCSPDCPEEPYSGWIDKKYIKKDKMKPKRQKKTFTVQKVER